MTTLPRWIGLAACLISSVAIAADTVADYVDHYLDMFPSKATAAGRYGTDDRLEQLDAASRSIWRAACRPVQLRFLGLYGLAA